MLPIWSSVSLLIISSVGANRTLCGQYQSFTSWPYMFNNNAWNEDGSGSVCTYVSESPSNAFYSIWQWTSEPPAVKAYPNVEFKSPFLPLQLGSLQSLRVSAAWSFAPSFTESGPQSDPNVKSDADAIATNRVEANVVFDVFGDEDMHRAQKPSEQGYEIMVWVGRFGTATLPIGNTKLLDPAVIARIDGTDFTLYKGENSNGQKVFSWVANHTLTVFDMDFAPLLGFLSHEKMISKDIFLGSIQFGSETFYSQQDMNFSILSYEADLQTTNPKGTGTSTAKGTLPVATQVPTGAASRYNLSPIPLSSILDPGLILTVFVALFILGCILVLCP